MDETMERGAVDETMDDQVDLDHGPWSSGRDHGGSGGRGGASGDVNLHGGAVGGWPPHQNRKPLGIRRPWRGRSSEGLGAVGTWTAFLAMTERAWRDLVTVEMVHGWPP